MVGVILLVQLRILGGSVLCCVVLCLFGCVGMVGVIVSGIVIVIGCVSAIDIDVYVCNGICFRYVY